jgi:DNA-binding MarR family transcriptional regulator
VGLYPGQEMLMMHLWDTGPQRVTDLVTVLDGDPATVTRMVARLEKTGFVRRTAGSVDRRTTIVESTEAGHALRAKVERLWRQLEQETVSGLDADEQAAALRLLSKLEAHLAETITS